MSAKPTPDVARAAAEFDIWARNGRDQSMARGHRSGTATIVEGWQLDGDSVVLDVGCGNGWALRWAAERGAGGGFGVDAAPEMVARARELTEEADSGARLRFEVATADALPLADESVSHVLNVESLYYYPDPAAALREWFRVARPGARLGIMADLYAEYPLAPAWVAALDIGVHLLSEAEIVRLCEEAGWSEVRTWRVPDEGPLKAEEDFEASVWTPSYALYLAAREAGSLVVVAQR